MANGRKKSLRRELLKTMIQLATAGFGLVAALAWNDTIKSLISHFISPGNTLISQLIYAMIITIIAVLVTYYLGRLIQEEENEHANES
ncbi:MAG: DUF5654 family protein [Patescibacteria group bacterium]|jgi:ABC-type transport system involved in multi-copper enzyme maturation permease subunit